MTHYADLVPLNWSDLAVSELPTGTVTLLLADVEGSTRLWENQPRAMTAAIDRLNTVVSEVIAGHNGARPLEQGEGDSFVAAFARASDAVACALALQRTDLGPIRMRIGVHSGEIQLRDESNYAGPTINRAARLRNLAHGGQTVLSSATEALVIDRLPEGVWLVDLGLHPLKDLPRPERVFGLHHPDLRADFPPLRSAAPPIVSRLPVALTSFVGRAHQVDDITGLVRDNRLVTLTGAGGVGKTRLAVRIAAGMIDEFGGEVFFVDLAPVTEPALVPVIVARALELADQPGRSVTDTILRSVRDRKLLVVLDNCEHLLDECSDLLAQLLPAGPRMSVLATSRESIGIPGEVTWRVPSLSADDEGVELFIDRARRAGTEPADRAVVADICRRLDGMPLAIELAAARTRTLSLPQILSGLQQSFRLLSGGARTAVRRQQTLAASIDWSHSLLTEPERTLLRRLAVFAGGFDLEAANAVGADSVAERAQLLDVLGLLVDKSLVIAEDDGTGMRFRVLETVRQYSLEKLAASGEADVVRTRHRDHYAATALRLESEMRGDGTPLVPWAGAEIDNLRAAFLWSCEIAEFGTALTMVSALHRLWVTRGRVREGLVAFEAAFGDDRYDEAAVEPDTWVRAVTDAGILAVWLSIPASLPRAERALVMARDTGDPRLLARILMTCGLLTFDHPDLAGSYLLEAIGVARDADDQPTLCEGLAYLTFALVTAGLPVQAQASGEEGRDLADRLGDNYLSMYCRVFLSNAAGLSGEVGDSLALGQQVVEFAQSCGDRVMHHMGLIDAGWGFLFTGDAASAVAAGTEALAVSAEMGGFHEDSILAMLATAELSRGDAAAAKQACDAALERTYGLKELFIRCLLPVTLTEMCCGNLVAARRWADDTVSVVPGTHQVWALSARARLAVAEGEPHRAEQDAHDALAAAERTSGYLFVSDALECLALLAVETNPRLAARLLGAGDGERQRRGRGRFAVYRSDFDATAAAAREALGADGFGSAFAEGEALTISEAIALAQRGRGERKRPPRGWESLTPTELDVVGLLRDGLSNRDIGARLFISPRTVQTHLSHVYGKLGLSTRVQVAQEASRHG